MPIPSPALKTSRGRLTRYGLSCGYVERCHYRDGRSLTMWMEHGCIHVRENNPDASHYSWDVFLTLTRARAHFMQRHVTLKAVYNVAPTPYSLRNRIHTTGAQA